MIKEVSFYHAMEPDKLFGGIGPARQYDIGDDDILIRLAHLVVIGVDQEFR